MTPSKFVSELSGFRFPRVFNPYADICHLVDRFDAVSIRCANLETYLQSLQGNCQIMWVGRDLGYRGGRRTGLALTDEGNLENARAAYPGAVALKATLGPDVAERTAAIIWRVIRLLTAPPLLWNVFPFHPHDEGNMLSNRCHTAAERAATRALLDELINWAKPKSIVAIGGDAARALDSMGIAHVYVRHPSYGGMNEFLDGMCKVHRLSRALTRSH